MFLVGAPMHFQLMAVFHYFEPSVGLWSLVLGLSACELVTILLLMTQYIYLNC